MSSAATRRSSNVVLVLSVVWITAEAGYAWRYLSILSPTEALSLTQAEVVVVALVFGLLTVYAFLLRTGRTRPWATIVRMSPERRRRASSLGIALSIVLYALVLGLAYRASLSSPFPATEMGNAVHAFALLVLVVGALLSIRPVSGEPATAAVGLHAEGPQGPPPVPVRSKAFWVAASTAVLLADFWFGGGLFGVLFLAHPMSREARVGLAAFALGCAGGLLATNTLFVREILRSREARIRSHGA